MVRLDWSVGKCFSFCHKNLEMEETSLFLGTYLPTSSLTLYRIQKKMYRKVHKWRPILGREGQK